MTRRSVYRRPWHLRVRFAFWTRACRLAAPKPKREPGIRLRSWRWGKPYTVHNPAMFNTMFKKHRLWSWCVRRHAACIDEDSRRSKEAWRT